MTKKKIVVLFILLFTLAIFFVPANATTEATKSIPSQVYQTTFIPITSIGVTNITPKLSVKIYWAYKINKVVLFSEFIGLTILFGGVFYVVGKKKE